MEMVDKLALAVSANNEFGSEEGRSLSRSQGSQQPAIAVGHIGSTGEAKRFYGREVDTAT